MVDHKSRFLNKYPQLAIMENEIYRSCDLLISCYEKGNKLLVCGNGGSAADAEHIVGELMKGFLLKRPLINSQKKLLQSMYPAEHKIISKNLQQAFPAISLVNAISLSTAFANDMAPDFVFAQQVFGIGRKGDVLFAISTSGNSKNILWAVKVARAQGLSVIGLTGESGGQLAAYCDVCLKVPASNVVDIQEYHLPVYHLLCMLVEEAVFGEERLKTDKKRFPDKVELIIFDFDGVFTNNKVYVDQNGIESVVCDRGDGLGVQMLRERGVPMLVLSTETNPVVKSRAKKLSLPVEFGCGNKKIFLTEYFKSQGIIPQNTIYIGNDLNDLEAMQIVGFTVAPGDAHDVILNQVNLVLDSSGGNGAVREFSEKLINQLKGE
jgi:D-sedoheptulose 7-phosphate isomerase